MEHTKENTKENWIKPEIRLIGKAKDLIKEAKFEGFQDGALLNGTTPIGPSS